MAKTLSLAPVAYVLKSERDLPADGQTRWNIRPLKWRERADVQDGVIVTEISMMGPKTGQRSGIMKHLSGTQARLALEKGLISVENLLGPDGSPVAYHQTLDPARKEEVLDSLDPEWTKEIAEEILRMSGLLKDEEKN